MLKFTDPNIMLLAACALAGSGKKGKDVLEALRSMQQSGLISEDVEIPPAPANVPPRTAVIPLMGR